MKEFILNRKSQKVAVVIDLNPEAKGLVFVMHGLGGFKEQPQIQTFASAFLEEGYSVIRFDTTNTFGESDGDYADATTTNYYEDLEDVIAWANTQPWYTEPFILVGHSIGSLCVTLFAENYPRRVRALAPISTVISGTLSMEAKEMSGEIEEWKKTGWRITPSESKPGVTKKLKWSHMEDRMRYDLLPHTSVLTMPVLQIVGELDDVTPLAHQQILFNKLVGKKDLQVIEGAEHNFRTEKELQKIKSLLQHWIKDLP